LEEARTLLQESVTVSRSARDQWGMGNALHHLGLLALAQGDAAEAQELQREAADLFAQVGEQRAHGLALARLGEAALALDDAIVAGEAFHQALLIAAQARIPPLGLQALLGMAGLYERDHRLIDAYTLLAVVSRQSASDYPTRAAAETRRADLAARLSAPDRQIAEEQARSCSVEQLFSRAISAASSQELLRS
jgi:hypothetical protein